MRILGALLAAGASRRFGPQDKLLATHRGKPLMLWAAEALLGAGCESLAAVVASPETAAILPPGFAPLRIAAGLPQSESLKAAVRAAQAAQADRLLLLLGDMPQISARTLRRLLAMEGSGARACLHEGRRLPPALLTAADFPEALRAEGDQGARGILARLTPEALLALSAAEAADVDRPEDLEALAPRPSERR